MRSPRQASAPLLAAALIGASAGPVAPARASEAPEPPEAPPLAITPLPRPAGVDDRDLLEVLGLRQPAGRPPEPKRGKLMLFVIPVFSSSPTTGFALGAGASGAVALGSPADTIVSSLSASLMVTTKEQLMTSLRSVIVTDRNAWELLGDFRYYRFSEPTYGLGTGDSGVGGGFTLNGLDTAALPGAQPMRFDYLKVHETVFRRVRGHAYLGAGYHLDVHRKIEDELLDLGAAPPAVTSHYAYSRVEGFDPTRYTLSGLSVDALYETRDHTLDPYRGVYALLSFRVNPTFLGSSARSSSVYGELRTYLPVSTTRPRHLLAVWLRADAVVSGSVPYLDLPAIGYDTRGRSGRGYAAGRFRGTSLAYAELEYRFPLTRSGVLGGVAFVSATTAARPALSDPSLGVNDPGTPLFDSIEPAGGAGLRIRVDRQARMNLVVDYAIGAGGASGFYLAVGEAF
jgi:hypothetical protein